MIAFLCSDDASYVSGQVIYVDGAGPRQAGTDGVGAMLVAVSAGAPSRRLQQRGTARRPAGSAAPTTSEVE